MWRSEHVKVLLKACVLVVVIACFQYACISSKAPGSLRLNDYSTLDKMSLSQIKALPDTSQLVQKMLRRTCRKVHHFYYDERYPFLHEKKKIRVNFHFINSLDSTQNFNPDKGIDFAKELIYYANGKLRENVQMKLPEGNETEVQPIPFRYVLTPNPAIPNDDGVYFHYVEDPFFVNHGKNSNNYDQSLIRELAVNKDTILNIFYMVHHPDSVRSRKYKASPAGIALGHSVKLGVNGTQKVNSWTHAGLLNHEIGHVLSLGHSWVKNDGCEDTPAHPNCWNTGPKPCDGVVSNNVMDYNSIQMAYTPCQIAKTYHTMMNETSSKRKLIIKEWCQLDEEKSITIRDTQIWSRTVDVYGNLTIERNAVLVSSCGINMPEDSKILIKAGGTFVLNNSTIKNDCGKEWEGIYIEKSHNDPAHFQYIDTFHIENTTEQIL